MIMPAGFEEKRDYLSLTRQDVGLLYLVHSVLEQSIAVIVN